MWICMLLLLGTQAADEKIADRPELTLKLIAEKGKPGCFWCEVTNPSKSSWYFLGYSPASNHANKLPDDRMAPHSRIQRLKHGQWVTDFDGRCGVGIGPVEFPAGAKATFYVVIRQPDDEVRVGITLLPSKNWENGKEIWSNSIKGEKQ